ncbi:hypothetical protein V2J56_02090 [Georgenia sp. MJ206]|uniref:hypothetical protein n=1 Tax=Georgenia wangjunii TaxID=3117730 RepID=UPI002F269141
MTRNDNVLDTAWESDFIVELRLRDVDGRTIGDALEQVRSHCAESGQPVRAAFGDPVAYARSLDLPGEPVTGLGTVIVRSVAGLVAMFLTLWGFTGWLDGEGFTLTLGRVAVLVLLVVAVLAIGRAIEFIVRHPWRASLVMGAFVAGIVVAEVLLTQALVVLPALAVVAVGAVGLLATSLWELRSAESDEDPVVNPVTGRDDDDGRAGRVLLALTPWLLPIVTAVLLLLLVALERLI